MTKHDDTTTSTSSTSAGVGFFGLVGMVVSSCIGSGVFKLTGQLGAVASPGAAIVAWLITGLGFLFLALSLANLGTKRPESDGVIAYADDGFGPFHGFISGWGYWLSAWLGNVAFGTMVAQTLGSDYCFGQILPGFFTVDGNPTFGGILVVSVVLWLITLLVIHGVESASFLNAVVMVVKVASIALFIMFSLFAFNAGIFTTDFWGNLSSSAGIIADAGGDALGSVTNQIEQCFLIMMWTFIGIEGASVMSKRAAKKSEVGSATVLGLVILLVIYIGASILPYGVMPYKDFIDIAYDPNSTPAMILVFEYLAPGWGGAFISWSIIISVIGSWLSFTMLPAETTSVMAEHHLLPAKWDERNSHNAPQFSLIIVGALTEIFIIVATLSSDAYNFAFSMCTVTIVITWAYAAAYQCKYSAEHHEGAQLVAGIIALAFQVIAMCLGGNWQFLLTACLGYIPGFFFYAAARKEVGGGLSKAEIVSCIIIAIIGVSAIPLNMAGIISVF